MSAFSSARSVLLAAAGSAHGPYIPAQDSLPASVPASAPAPTTVRARLRFAWPEQARATVRDASRQGEVDVQTTYRLEWHKEEDGSHLLSLDDLRYVSYKGFDASTPYFATLMAQIGDMQADIPSQRIGPHGHFAGIQDYEGMVAQVLEKFSRGGMEPDKLLAVSQSLSSQAARERSERSARESWDQWVGSWNGLALADGQQLESDVSIKLPGGRIASAGTRKFQCLGRERRAGVECVHLTSYQQLLGPAYTQSVLPRLAELAPDLESTRIRQIERLEQAEVWLEAETLVPHSVKTHSVWKLFLTGELVPRKLEQSRELAFEWDPAPAASRPADAGK